MTVAETLAKLPELTVEQAEAWITATMAEANALRQYDDDLYPQAGDVAALDRAHHLHDAWRRWADVADALYQRVRPLLQGRAHVNGAADLDYAIARARASVQLTPEVMQARRAQVERGETKSLEEVRRELRASPRG